MGQVATIQLETFSDDVCAIAVPLLAFNSHHQGWRGPQGGAILHAWPAGSPVQPLMWVFLLTGGV